MSRHTASALVLAVAAFLMIPFESARAADFVTVTGVDEEFTAPQRAKLLEAVALANRVLASPELRTRLSAIGQFSYSRSDGAKVYQDLTGRTYSLRFEGVAQYAVNFFGIKRVSKMVASTGHGSGQITFNTLRMHEFPASYYAGTIVHELSHICTDSSSGSGYSHRGNRATSANLRSVPYRVGELVAELAEGSVPAAAPGPTSGLTDALGSTVAPAPAPREAPGAVPGPGDREQKTR